MASLLGSGTKISVYLNWFKPVKVGVVTVAKKPPEPASRRLASVLRDEISEGVWPPGGRLPSERALASEYGIARNTARESARLLAQEGLVTAEHGRGVFVRVHPRLMRFGAHRYSKSLRLRTGLSPYHAEVSEQGRTPSAECTSITEVEAPPSVAERLWLKPGEMVVRRENWYYADGEPIQIGVTFIPVAIAAGSPLADSADLGDGDLYARFEDAGFAIARIREEVLARMPDRTESTGLSLPPGVPVLEVTHTGIDEENRPFEVTRFVMRGDLSGLDYSMPVEN
jgi:GntR family transcriptional regulator